MQLKNRTYTIDGKTYDSPTQVAVAYKISGLSFSAYSQLTAISGSEMRSTFARDYPGYDEQSIDDLAAAISAYALSMLD